MNRELLMLVDAISREKSVDRDVVFGTVEAARAFVALQYVLPQHFLTSLVHAVTRTRVRWVKDALIDSFIANFHPDMSDAVPKRLLRRYYREMGVAMAAYIVTICSSTMRLISRYVVPNFLCGLRNHSVSTPSSDTRFRTPLEPMMEVLMAPERIRKPTTTTKTRKTTFRTCGPTIYMAMPLIRLSR